MASESKLVEASSRIEAPADHVFETLANSQRHMEWRIEVGETTTDGGEVLLTPNEVTHAGSDPRARLCVLAGFTVESGAESEVRAPGRKVRSYEPWKPEPEALIPQAFETEYPRPDRRTEGPSPGGS